MAKTVKTIKISALAKELGIDSKVIVEKCNVEDLGDRIVNNGVALGLAETIRGWAADGSMAALIEKHAASSTSSKKKKAPARKKAGAKADEDEGGSVATLVEEEPGESTAVGTGGEGESEDLHDDAADDEDAQSDDAEAKPKRAKVARSRVTKKVSESESAESSPADADIEAVTYPAESTDTVVTAIDDSTLTTSSDAVAEQPAAAPADVTPPPPPQSADDVARVVENIHGGVKVILATAPARPTVKLERNTGAAKPDRQVFVPKPATLAGPKVVREETPDVVSAPRKRLGPNTPQQPLTTPSTARGGRGVRVTEEEEGEEKKKDAKGKPISARRRGPDGRRGEADEKLREFSDADLKDRADRISAASAARHATDLHLRKTEARGTHVQARTAAQRGGVLEVDEPITIRNLSAELGVKSNEIISKLMKQGIFANVNQALELEVAQELALGYNVELVIRQQPSLEDLLMAEFDSREVPPDQIIPRPPVVTILGHVDHGKTSLLDKIRSANVAAGESGGITQHIAAWQVQTGDKRVTFIDTPGHQAFTAMRARGANMTDVVVLVISAAEGVQPQTVESINHAKAAEVPIIVALNKIDRDDANPDMVLGQLASHDLNPAEWGGTVEVVRTSALTGQGIPELIETLEYQTDLRELKGFASGPARGSVIESRMDPGLGPVATVLVQDGTLKVGDVVLAGTGWGRVRSLLNDQLKQVQNAGPSTPIIISGLSELPQAGDKFFCVDSADRARSITEERVNLARANQAAERTKVSLESLYGQMQESTIKTINLIIKADVQGSVETLQKTVTEQNTQEVRVKVIHAAAGPISESDVELADASNAVIIGFHVVPDESARSMAEQRRVEVRTYRVIYEIFDDLKKALSGMLAPEIREKLHGHLEIRAVFKVSRVGNIAGCFVTDGHVQRGSKIRLIRDGTIITEDLSIETLKRLKDDVKEVRNGFECGLKIANYDDIKIGDVLEAYTRETIQRTL